MTHGAWAGALLMFRPLSAPSRAARQKVSTAEHWKAASPNWEPNTPTRSSRCTTWPISCGSKASWRRPGRGLWGAERWPSWHCREEGVSHVSFPSFTGAIWECELMPRLMYGQILIWVWWGSISRQGEPFEIECWTALLLVNLLWNYWVNHQRQGPSKSEGLLSPRTEFIMFCEWFWWSSTADCGEFPQFLTGVWNSIFSLKSKKCGPRWRLLLPINQPWNHGTWSSSHVSPP